MNPKTARQYLNELGYRFTRWGITDLAVTYSETNSRASRVAIASVTSERVFFMGHSQVKHYELLDYIAEAMRCLRAGQPIDKFLD